MGSVVALFRSPYPEISSAEIGAYLEMYPHLTKHKIKAMHSHFMKNTNGLGLMSYSDLKEDSRALVGTEVLEEIHRKIAGIGEHGYLEFPEYVCFKAKLADKESLIQSGWDVLARGRDTVTYEQYVEYLGSVEKYIYSELGVRNVEWMSRHANQIFEKAGCKTLEPYGQVVYAPLTRDKWQILAESERRGQILADLFKDIERAA